MLLEVANGRFHSFKAQYISKKVNQSFTISSWFPFQNDEKESSKEIVFFVVEWEALIVVN